MGWSGPECTKATCDPPCLNQGECTGPDVCKCPDTWEGPTCGKPAKIYASVVQIIAFLFVSFASWSLGRLLKKKGKVPVPKISVYIITGVVAGPFVLKFLNPLDIRALHFVNEAALAFIAIAAGAEFQLEAMKGRERAIAMVTVFLILIEYTVGTAVALGLSHVMPFTKDMIFVNRFAVSMLFGSLLVARSPASAIAIVMDLKADGPFTRLAIGVTVVMDMCVIFLFTTNSLVSQIIFSTGFSPWTFLGKFLVQIIISLVGGLMLGWVLPRVLWSYQYLIPADSSLNDEDADMKYAWLLKIIATIQTLLLLTVGWLFYWFSDNPTESGVLSWISLEPLVLLMIAGFVISNFSIRHHDVVELLTGTAPAVYACFFTLAGAALALDVVIHTIGYALILCLVRVVTIAIGAYVGGRLSGEPDEHNKKAWLAYITQAGVALGLAQKVQTNYPSWGDDFTTIITALVVINQVVGPPCFRWVVSNLGEAGALLHKGAADAITISDLDDDFGTSTTSLLGQSDDEGDDDDEGEGRDRPTDLFINTTTAFDSYMVSHTPRRSRLDYHRRAASPLLGEGGGAGGGPRSPVSRGGGPRSPVSRTLPRFGSSFGVHKSPARLLSPARPSLLE